MNGSLLSVRDKSAPDWMILAIACVAQFMVVLDVSIVNVALPSIGHDLHYSSTGLQWVVNAYVLTFAGFLLLGGRAADLFGRRRVYLAGMALFTLASLVGGFAQNSGWLTAARAVQGLGGAILSPATLTIIVTTFSGPRLARALGLWGAVAGAGGAFGSILGGVLTAEISWRWVLFVNVPIGAAAGLAALWFLSEMRRPNPDHKLDIAGAITVTAGLSALAYAVVGTSTYGWTSTRTLGVLGAAAALLVVFGFIEVYAATTPLVPFGLFRSRWVTGANIVMFLIGAAFFSQWYFLTLYLQDVLGFSALRTGAAFLPSTIAIIIGAQLSTRVMTRIGVRPVLLAGTALATGGFLWMTQLQSTGGWLTHVLGPGCLVAFALGLLFAPLAGAATTGVPPGEAGLASGVLNTSRQVGGSLGLAVLATIAVDRTQSLHALGYKSAHTGGFTRAFAVAAVLTIVAFLSAFVVPWNRPALATKEAVDRSSDLAIEGGVLGAELT
jgi:EmrB/QacA subfamily drug resistance transporter